MTGSMTSRALPIQVMIVVVPGKLHLKVQSYSESAKLTAKKARLNMETEEDNHIVINAIT